eukprot:TRINITY_DN3131_c1_g1_i2.p1 TRINITY_DN3131_c1_g1~~TRINITY_DN3131_c1_g1_i2.p1  ORF type:complete len:150 (+),score=14.81 TRINITY_DN3131_c1_g1_i2:177-626(+)
MHVKPFSTTAAAQGIRVAPGRRGVHGRKAVCYAEPSEVSTDSPLRQEEATQAASTCAHCGAPISEVPFGCDQQGHKAGGMGAFFEWWPVKAWGPCPKAAAAGLAYPRKGQGTNEMLFGPGDDKQLVTSLAVEHPEGPVEKCDHRAVQHW